MKKAKIYIPSRSATQSGKGKTKKWLLKFLTREGGVNPLMGWQTSDDTMNEVVLEFSTKEKAIDYAKKNNILYEVTEPKKSHFIIKSYSDNFLKD